MGWFESRLWFAIYLLPGLVIGLTFHEAAHALSAKWLGDRYAERMGRITLNPLKHLSPLGTLALFILGFGWGKPVTVNLYNFRRPKLYYLLSSVSGPAANLLLCAISLTILYSVSTPLTDYFFRGLFLINAILAVINLIPIPPLDGSKIWPCLIPGMRPTVSAKWTKVWLVVLLVLLFSGGLDRILIPALRFLASLLPQGT